MSFYNTVFISLIYTITLSYECGIPLPMSDDQITYAQSTQTLTKLFRDQVNAHPLVLFTGLKCSFSQEAKDLMDTYYPKLIYYYYDWDKTPAGIIFLSESTKLKHGTCNHLPQIWIWGQYIGELTQLKKLHADGTLAQRLQQCPQLV